MTIRTLLPDTEPLLHLPCEPCDLASRETQDMVEDLIHTFYSMQARGLAASQIGFPKRAFIMCVRPKPVMICLNPFILGYIGEPIQDEEGCLSYPGKSLGIERYPRIEVEYFDRIGRKRRHFLNEMSARVFQHEYDHTNGITMYDRRGPYNRSLNGETR